MLTEPRSNSNIDIAVSLVSQMASCPFQTTLEKTLVNSLALDQHW